MGIMDTKKELTQIAKVRIGLCCVSFLSAIAAFVECKGTILPLEYARYILTFNFSVFMIQFTFLPAFFTNENFVVPQPVDPKLQMIMRLFGSFGLITLGMTQFINLDIYIKWAATVNAVLAFTGPICAELAFECTPKHIVPPIAFGVATCVILATIP